MAEVKDLTLATKAQVEAATTFFIIAADTADTDTDSDDPLKVDVATMKSVFGVGPSSEGTISSLGTSFTDIGSPLTDNDIVFLYIEGTISGDVNIDGDIIPVDRLGTTAKWIPVKGGASGVRIEIKKLSTGQIQVRRQGPISNVYIELFKIT